MSAVCGWLNYVEFELLQIFVWLMEVFIGIIIWNVYYYYLVKSFEREIEGKKNISCFVCD